MILYTVGGKDGSQSYVDIELSGDLTNKGVYVNLTNKCPCSCTFCLRQTKKMSEEHTLWLKEGEPTVEEVLEKMSHYDLSVIKELTFCGFGEPLERLDDICAIIDAIKPQYPDLSIRVNTNGLANLMYNEDITPKLAGRFNTVSISLNAADEVEYLELTRSIFGIQSYSKLQEFATLAKRYVPNVVLTVVEKVMPEDKIAICQKICDDLGVKLRVRAFEE